MALVMVNTQINLGNFPQAGMAYLHLAMIACTRFNMIKFACDMGDICKALLANWSDPTTTGRGGSIYGVFVGHLHRSIQESMVDLEGSLEYSIQVGDRGSTILNFGLVGMLKFFASENLTELESFLHYGCEEVPNWNMDSRGGTMASKYTSIQSKLAICTISHAERPRKKQFADTSLQLRFGKLAGLCRAGRVQANPPRS